jgi:hypothetical protein
MGIDQKVAVITGASRNIGAALVEAYRDHNYRNNLPKGRVFRKSTIPMRRTTSRPRTGIRSMLIY